MQYPKLELQIAQVERLIANSRKKFRNKKKEQIYNSLILLFKNIKASDYTSFNSQELSISKLALDIVFYGVEFLDYKNENEIPKRLIFCLNRVLDDWIATSTNEYFIVVSYNKTPDQFFIRAYDEEQLRSIKLSLKYLFNIEYTQSLIQISKPKFLFNDYLSSVPLYHELGHFIDKNYQITKSLSKEPGFTGLDFTETHFSEFFADIFAAQYIGKSSTAPLDELKKTSSTTHPSNAQRVEVVNTFIDGTGSTWSMKIVKELNRICEIRTAGRKLEIRFEELKNEENPFISLTPQIIGSSKKLHSLFNLGWQHWLNLDSPVRKKYTRYSDCSYVINKLIRDSVKLTMQHAEASKLKKIGNYFGNIAAKYGITDN
ncbi:MAG TPA: hypothetical protein VGM63_00280 [Mucilaginibacter sp.]|jgi:hypothetical protein